MGARHLIVANQEVYAARTRRWEGCRRFQDLVKAHLHVELNFADLADCVRQLELVEELPQLKLEAAEVSNRTEAAR
jgi:hypothetical protein